MEKRDEELYLQQVADFVEPYFNIDYKNKIIEVPQKDFMDINNHAVYKEISELKSLGFSVQSIII